MFLGLVTSVIEFTNLFFIVLLVSVMAIKKTWEIIPCLFAVI